MTHVLLTSIGLSAQIVYDRVSLLKQQLDIGSCTIITNAVSDGAGKYIALAQEQFKELGLSVSIVDLFDPHAQATLSKSDCIYIAGGNTFKLLHDLRKGVGLSLFTDLIRNTKIVIGVSAGAIILTPTIRIANEIEPDSNDCNLTNFNALSLINHELLPHYSDRLNDAVNNYEKKYFTSVIRLSDEGLAEYIV